MVELRFEPSNPTLSFWNSPSYCCLVLDLVLGKGCKGRAEYDEMQENGVIEGLCLIHSVIINKYLLNA